jgi:hypothetical protein
MFEPQGGGSCRIARSSLVVYFSCLGLIYFVMTEKRVVIFLIAFAIVIQNTCPYGWAAKTAFVSPYTSHCPHCPKKEDHQPAKSDSRNDVKKDVSSINHLFMIHIGKLDTAFQLLSPTEHAPSIKSDDFMDVYLEPLLRPPCRLS